MAREKRFQGGEKHPRVETLFFFSQSALRKKAGGGEKERGRES